MLIYVFVKLIELKISIFGYTFLAHITIVEKVVKRYEIHTYILTYR